jgi:hypothetical protein
MRGRKRENDDGARATRAQEGRGTSRRRLEDGTSTTGDETELLKVGARDDAGTLGTTREGRTRRRRAMRDARTVMRTTMG